MSNLRSITEWANDFANRTNVQPDAHQKANKAGFLSGESAVVVSGPASLRSLPAGPMDLIPVGLVQSTQITQNKQLNELFEIGGRDSFFIPGRTQVQASLSRILFDGPSLFYALYQRSDGDQTTLPDPADFGVPGALNKPTAPYGSGLVDIRQDGKSDPGLFWSNLGASIFNKPLGFGFVMYNMSGIPYGGLYLEMCYIQGHSIGISSTATVLAENVSIRATRVRPINAASLADHAV